jgi:hypothetical protein
LLKRRIPTAQQPGSLSIFPGTLGLVVRGPDFPRALQAITNATFAQTIGRKVWAFNADEILPLTMLEFVSESLSKALVSLASRSANGGLGTLHSRGMWAWLRAYGPGAPAIFKSMVSAEQQMIKSPKARKIARFTKPTRDVGHGCTFQALLAQV